MVEQKNLLQALFSWNMLDYIETKLKLNEYKETCPVNEELVASLRVMRNIAVMMHPTNTVCLL